MTGNPGVQEWECSFHLCLNGALDGGFNRVQVAVEQLNLFLLHYISFHKALKYEASFSVVWKDCLFKLKDGIVQLSEV